ncbi:biliverdin-producing heme oxygenase [Roseibium sp. ROS1]
MTTQTSVRLRADTRLSHEVLDKEVSRFDLTTSDGFLCFLGMQSHALQALAALEVSAKTKSVLADLHERAEQDLRGLGSSIKKTPFEIGPLHPLAVDYALAGSRLGSQVLKRRWQAAKNPQVRRASAYFSAPSYIELWTSFCGATEAMTSSGPLADRIVKDAERVLQFYRECARAPQLTEGAINA